MDEADYLGDHVTILQAPGKLLALDNPVGLKTRLGRGYTLAVDTPDSASASSSPHAQHAELLEQLRRDSPDIRSKSAKGKELFLTGSTDLALVRKLVDRMQLERSKGKQALQYQVNGATLEEVFLDLNSETTTPETTSQHGPEDPTSVTSPGWEKGVDGTDIEKGGIATAPGAPVGPVVPVISRSHAHDNPPLTPGHKRSFILSIPIDAFTIFRKRLLNLRRAWLLPLIGAIVVICGTCIPLFFMEGRNQTCASVVRRATTQVLTWPQSPYPILYPPLVLAPASSDNFGNVFNNPFLSSFVQTEPDNTSFVDVFTNDYRNQDFGGISIASDPSESSLFAWEGSNLLNKGLSSLNLISNAVLNQISPSDTNPLRITLGYRPLPSPSFLSTAEAMRWIGFLYVPCQALVTANEP